MKNIVIFDLDGTLALIDHRRHLVELEEAMDMWWQNLSIEDRDEYLQGYSLGSVKLINHFKKITGWKPNWDLFFEECDKDQPNSSVIEVYRQFIRHSNWRVYIFSGRSESVRQKTWAWLDNHNIPRPMDLLMRPEKDYTPDDQLKAKWLDEIGAHNVLFTVDDRQKVVDMWRSKGITCFQVAPGNF